VRDEAGLEKALDRIESIYRRALETPPFGDASPAAELRAASRYLLFSPEPQGRVGRRTGEDRLAAENREQRVRVRELETAGRGTGADRMEIAAELARMRATLTWRSREFLLQSAMVRAVHRGARAFSEHARLLASATSRATAVRRRRAGGSVTYGTLTARRLGWEAAILTSAGPDFEPERELPGIPAFVRRASATTRFVNEYDADGRATRS